MIADDFDFRPDDPTELPDYRPNPDYRRRVEDSFKTGGIAGPMDGGYPSPTAPKTGYDLEGFRKRWTSSGDVNNAAGWLDANRDITGGVTLKNEKAYDPSGKFIADLVGNYSGAPTSSRSRIFLDGIGSNGQKRVGGTKGPMTDAARAAGGKSAAAPANTFLTDIRKLITDRLGAMKGQPSITDPALAAQSGAYRRSLSRSDADERAELAERAAANGTLMGGQSSGGFDTNLQGIKERSGESAAAFDADLVGDEVESRRSEVLALMDMALQSGDAESARTLSRELANLDATLRREGLSQQNSQFNANLNQNRYVYDDTRGYNVSRDAEDDYRWRVNQGMG